MGATNPGPWEAGQTGRRWSLGFHVGIRAFANRPEAGAPQGSFWNLVHLGENLDSGKFVVVVTVKCSYYGSGFVKTENPQ